MAATQLPQATVKACTIASPSAGRVVKQIDLWLTANGIEWTVGRLKAIRTAALQLRAGNLSVVKQIYQEESIAYYKDTLFPRGPYKVIMLLYSAAQSPVALRRVDLILRAYTGLKLDKLSRRQFRKAFKAITEESGVTPEELNSGNGLVLDGANLLGLPNNVRVRNPSVAKLKASTSTYSVGVVPTELRNIPYGKVAWSLSTAACAPESLMNDYPQADAYRLLVIDGGADEQVTGRIAFLQEKGAKARVVAVPNAWHQWLFEPLHDALDNLAKGISVSAVHDQVKGAWFIQDFLGRESKLFSFDLSSATDRFPLQLQLTLLRRLGLDRYCEPLEDACHNWWVDTPYFKGFIDYAVGQPMGLYGSFPLFHLTHCCLLAGICSRVGYKDLSSRPFLVLGDDVLIRDSKVANLYKAALDSLHVPTSPTKSICSDLVSEFAGFVGLKTSHGVTVYRPYKHGNRWNGISLIHACGHRLDFLPKWKEWVAKYEKTRTWRLPDLTPLVPGDKPPGRVASSISLERFANLLHLITSGTLDWDSVDYVVPDFEWSDDWRDVVSELFDEQPDQVDNPLDVKLDYVQEGPHEDPFTKDIPRSVRMDPVIRRFYNPVYGTIISLDEDGMPIDISYYG